MAEFVQQSIEEMVGELHEMRTTNLFDASELRGILRKRKAFEYKLRRKTKEKKDYLQYIRYEINVLELIKQRRKESKCTIKVKNIEVPIIKRIHKLFELVCIRFKDDLKLYLSHIEFCTSRCLDSVLFERLQLMIQTNAGWHEKKLTSRIFTNILKIHPHKPDLWIMAAKHEIESRDSMSNARALLQQGIRVNQTSQKLWIEAMRKRKVFNTRLNDGVERIILSLVGRRFHACGAATEKALSPSLRQVLGTAKFPFMSSRSAESREIRAYFRMELLNAEMLHNKLDGITSEITEINDVDSVVLTGSVAGLVYKNACSEFTDDVKLRIKFLSVSQLFDFTETLQNVIYADLATNFSQDEKASAAVAKRPLINSKDSEGAGTFKQFSQCFQLFVASVTRIPTVAMWTYYLETCLELVEKEASTQHSLQLVVHTSSVFRQAADVKLLSEKMAIKWISFLVNVGKVEESLRVVERATVDMFPSSVSLWLHRVQLSIYTSCDIEKILKNISDALTSCADVKSEELLSLWKTSLEWSVMNCPPQRTVELLERGLNSSDFTVVLYVKNVYLEITAARDSVRTVRHLYRRLSTVEPASVELLRKYITLELNQVKPKLKAIRQAYDEALLAFGSTSVDIWLDYISLELKHKPQAVCHLHWRAVKDLDSSLVDEFTQRFALISSTGQTQADS